MGFRGRRAAGDVFHAETFHLSQSGAQTLSLTATPDPESVHVYCNGVHQLVGSAYNLNEAIGSVSLLAGAPLGPEAGDYWTVKYAELPGAPALPELVSIPFSAGGWPYLLLPSNTDPSDYSEKGYDETSWSVGETPFGDQTGTEFTYPYNGGKFATLWPTASRIWVRRRFYRINGATLTIRVDNGCDVWWNGVSIGSVYADTGSPYVTNPLIIEVPVGLIDTATGDNVLAIRATDGNTVGGNNVNALDVRVDVK